jgi:hypothetical protein
MKVYLRDASIQISIREIAIAIFVLTSGYSSSAQNFQLQTKNGLTFATVVFTRAFATETPRFYSIAIDATGSTTYQSAPASLAVTGVPYELEFTSSPAVRDKVFRIVRELNFLKPPVSNLQKPTQNESVDTLTFREGKIGGENINGYNEVTYRSSTNPNVQQITSLFEGLSETLEFGRQLTYLRERRNPALNAELEHMENLAHRGRLLELFVVAPLLEQIASDQTMDEVARRSARRVLRYAQAAGE